MAYHPHIIFHLVQVGPEVSTSHTSEEELGSTVRGKTVKEHVHSQHLIEDYVKKNFLLFFLSQGSKDSAQWLKRLKWTKGHLGTEIEAQLVECLSSIHKVLGWIPSKA